MTDNTVSSECLEYLKLKFYIDSIFFNFSVFRHSELTVLSVISYIIQNI